MPSREELSFEKRIKALKQGLDLTEVLHIRTRFLIYERGPEDTPVLVEERPDLDLLISPALQIRKLRHKAADKDAWDREAATARLIDLPITCHAAQYEAISDDTSKVVGVFGGNRAGKTEAIAWWIFRKWLIQGGFGKRFWWISPNWKQTRIGVQKLCVRRGNSPPIIPPELRTYFPKNERSIDQAIHMFDGARIEFHHGNGDGDNLKGYDIEAGVYDELTSIDKIENWRIGKARTMDSRGQVATASTPKQGHWARHEIVARARFSDDVSHVELTCFDNPWVSKDEIARLIAADGGERDPTVRREYFGEWVADATALWPDWRPDEHIRVGDVWSPLDINKLDITEQVARGFWDSNGTYQYVVGQDFNVNPMTSVICSIFGDPDDPSTWGVLVVDEVQTRGNVLNHAAHLEKRYGTGVPIACDSTGALPGTHPSQGAKGSNTNALLLREAGFDCKPCYRRRGTPANPRVIDSLNLMHRLFRQGRIIVHSRCHALITALDTQEANPDGSIAKQSGALSDRISAPTDALRYLVWALFSKRELKKHVTV